MEVSSPKPNVQSVSEAVLGKQGEILEGGTITRIEVHPEFQRYYLTWPDQTGIAVEIRRWDREHIGLCRSGTQTLFPRPELQVPVPESPNGSAAYDVLCARLESHPFPEDPPSASSFRWINLDLSPLPSSLYAVGLLGALALLLAGFRAPLRLIEGTAWALFGLLLRWVLVKPGIFNGAEAGYEKLVIGLGRMHNSPYGNGFETLLAPWLSLTGPTPAGIYTANLGMSALGVGLIWAWGLAEGGLTTARAAALFWALLPVSLMLSRSEEMSVGVVTLGLVALASVSHFRKGGPAFLPVLAAAALGLAIHTRPEALTLLPVVVAFGFGRVSSLRRGLSVVICTAVVTGLIVLRLPLGAGQQNVLHPSSTFHLLTLLKAFLPSLNLTLPVQQLALQLHFTPPLLPVLAVLGLLRAERAHRLRLLLGWACLTLPLLTKCYPVADLLRLQHPALLIWTLSAGLGISELAKRLPRLWVPLVLVGTAPWWWHPQTDWANQTESRWLAEVVPTLPAEARVLYPDPLQRADKFRMIMEDLGPARWSGGGDAQGLLYIGVSCYLPEAAECRSIQERCRLTPLQTTELPARADLDLNLGGRSTVLLGFYRIESCGPTAATTAPPPSPPNGSGASSSIPGATPDSAPSVVPPSPR